MVYAVIDTNVLVAALLSKHADSSTVVMWCFMRSPSRKKAPISSPGIPSISQ